MGKLSASLEDYIELIYNLLEESQAVKAIDISKKFNISRASVSESLGKLIEKRLIIYDSRKNIQMTKEGKKQAQTVISKHNILKSFFAEVLCLDEKVSEDNACRIEHVISDDVFFRIKMFRDYCLENSDIISAFRKDYKAAEDE